MNKSELVHKFKQIDKHLWTNLNLCRRQYCCIRLFDAKLSPKVFIENLFPQISKYHGKYVNLLFHLLFTRAVWFSLAFLGSMQWTGLSDSFFGFKQKEANLLKSLLTYHLQESWVNHFCFCFVWSTATVINSKEPRKLSRVHPNYLFSHE